MDTIIKWKKFVDRTDFKDGKKYLVYGYYCDDNYRRLGVIATIENKIACTQSFSQSNKINITELVFPLGHKEKMSIELYAEFPEII